LLARQGLPMKLPAVVSFVDAKFHDRMLKVVFIFARAQSSFGRAFGRKSSKDDRRRTSTYEVDDLSSLPPSGSRTTAAETGRLQSGSYCRLDAVDVSANEDDCDNNRSN
jgi:hypothetical protein